MDEVKKSGERVSNLKITITATGAIISTLIGAGTASGQEISQFFVSFGFKGIGAILIAIVLHVFFFATIVNDSYNLEAQSSSDLFNYYAGNTLGRALDIFTTFFVFVVFVVMISGAGATLEQYWGIPTLAGNILVAFLVVCCVLLNFRKLISILGKAGIAIIVMFCLIGITSLIQNFGQLALSAEKLKNIELLRPAGVKNWIVSGIVYTGFVVPACVPFLTGMGAKSIDIKNTKIGVAIGSGLMVFSVGIVYLAMLTNVTDIVGVEVPTLILAEKISPVFGIVFAVLIFAALCSTAVPLLWSICNAITSVCLKIVAKKRKNDEKDIENYCFKITAIVATIIGFFGSNLGFGFLISVIYPIAGYVGIAIMTLVLIRKIRNKFVKL